MAVFRRTDGGRQDGNLRRRSGAGARAFPGRGGRRAGEHTGGGAVISGSVAGTVGRATGAAGATEVSGGDGRDSEPGIGGGLVCEVRDPDGECLWTNRGLG